MGKVEIKSLMILCIHWRYVATVYPVYPVTTHCHASHALTVNWLTNITHQQEGQKEQIIEGPRQKSRRKNAPRNNGLIDLRLLT